MPAISHWEGSVGPKTLATVIALESQVQLETQKSRTVAGLWVACRIHVIVIIIPEAATRKNCEKSKGWRMSPITKPKASCGSFPKLLFPKWGKFI